MEKLYTLKEAKGLSDVTTRTIQRWYKGGKIKIVRTIGGRRVPGSEIKRLSLREESPYDMRGSLLHLEGGFGKDGGNHFRI